MDPGPLKDLITKYVALSSLVLTLGFDKLVITYCFTQVCRLLDAGALEDRLPEEFAHSITLRL